MESPIHENDKSKKRDATEELLTPAQNILTVKGKLFYHESAQAHNIIRLTKEVILQYPQLREKRSSFCYKMIVPRTQEEYREHLKELRRNTNKIPIILFLGRDIQNEKV